MTQNGDQKAGLMNKPAVVFIFSILAFGGFFLLLDLGLMQAQGLNLLFKG